MSKRAQNCFFIELSVYGIWPLRFGPFLNKEVAGSALTELETKLGEQPHRLQAVIFCEVNEAIEPMSWLGQETMQRYGIGERDESLPRSVADLPLLRITLAYNFLERTDYTFKAHGIALSLSPEALSMGIQANIEAGFYESFGAIQGAHNAAVFYLRMLGDDGLSEQGHEVLSRMLDGVLKSASDNTQSAPDAPLH